MAASNEIPFDPRGEDDVDDVGQRHVVVVGPLVVAPAEMHAGLVGRHVGEGVVERLDVQARGLAELLGAERRVLDVAAHRQVRAVDLQHEPRPGHRLVLGAHRLGDREQVLLVAAVVLVAEEERDDARRGGGQKALGRFHPGQRGAEVGGVSHGGAVVTAGDGAGAGRRLSARAARVAEDAAGHAGEVDEILVPQGVAGAGEPGQAVLGVGGVGRLAHLAVVDDVDAGLDLLADNLGHRGADARGQGGGIHRHAFLFGEHRPDQILRTRKAAGVRRQEAFGAALHPGRFRAWCPAFVSRAPDALAELGRRPAAGVRARPGGWPLRWG